MALLYAHGGGGNLCNLVDRKRQRETKKGMALTPLRRCSFHVFVAYRVYSPIRLAVSMETRGKTYRFSLWTPLKENSFKNLSVPFRSSLILAESFFAKEKLFPLPQAYLNPRESFATGREQEEARGKRRRRRRGRARSGARQRR